MLFFTGKTFCILLTTTLLCVIANPVARKADGRVSDITITNPTLFNVPDPAENINSSTLRRRSHFADVRRRRVNDINQARPAPKCFIVHKGFYQRNVIVNLWTDTWYNQKKGEGQVSNERAMQLLKKEIKGCGAITKWQEGKGINNKVNMITFDLPETAKKGCVGRAFRSASSLPDINCQAKHDALGIFNVVALAVGVATIAVTLGASIANSAATASLSGLSEGAVAAGEVIPVEVAAAEVPVAQAGVGVVDEVAAGTLSQAGKTIATELSPIYPHASIPQSLKEFPKLVVESSRSSWETLSGVASEASSSSELIPLRGEISDSFGRIFSRTAGEVGYNVNPRTGLATRGWQDLADASNQLFGHTPIRGWQMYPPIEGWYPPSIIKRNATVGLSLKESQNSSMRQTTIFKSKIGVQIFQSGIDRAPPELEWGGIVDGDVVVGNKPEIEKYINSLYYCMFGC